MKINENEIFRICDESSELYFELSGCETAGDFQVFYFNHKNIDARLCIKNGENQAEVSLQMKADWPEDCPRQLFLSSPLIKSLADFDKVYPPAKPFKKGSGKGVLQINPVFSLPFVAVGRDGGVAVEFPVSTYQTSAWDQKRNHDFRSISSVDQLRSHSFLIRLTSVYADILEFKITSVKSWGDAFCKYREEWRREFDFSAYDAPEKQWYKDMLIQHFTYLYSGEIFDYDSDRIDIDRLIKAGGDFGGYDAVLLWHQYPRLGVDERSQWDFFSDFPGGIEGLAEITEAAHRRGIKVFLPYKPWDNAGGRDSVDILCSLLNRVKPDGIFFDTMDSIPQRMKKAVASAAPSVVFCTEMQPSDMNQLPVITGSWDQHGWEEYDLPEVNLMRFMLPEHISPMIARWKIGAGKDKLIQRAVFNGSGLVIWQDIFGTWLPYDKTQKAKIKKWKRVLTEYKDIFFCKNPIPLCNTLAEQIYCNKFSDNGKTIFTVYNASDKAYSGSIVTLADECAGKRAGVVWNESNCEAYTDGNILFGSIEAKSVICVLVE